MRRRLDRFPGGIDPDRFQAEVVKPVWEHAAVHSESADAGGAVICEFPGKILLRIAFRIEEHAPVVRIRAVVRRVIFLKEARIYRIVFKFRQFSHGMDPSGGPD